MELKQSLLLAKGYGATYTVSLKDSTSLNKFKSKINPLCPEKWQWKLCTIYLKRNGYLQVTN